MRYTIYMDAAHSYELHRAETEAYAGTIPSIMQKRDTIDAHIHRRLNDLVRPLVIADRSASWLTVGDFGGDAYYLAMEGATAVTASSISDTQLLAIKSIGYLSGVQIRALNAENMDLPDDAFDYVLCKQAFHHLPRPMIAFYELLRVARRGVLFLEPVDEPKRAFDFLRGVVKRILRGDDANAQLFETVGNFMYRLSTNEIFKAACALQLSAMAVRHINVFSWARLSPYDYRRSLARVIYELGCKSQDVLTATKLMSPGFVACFIAKAPLTNTIASELRLSGYRVISIPKNPYLG